MIMLATVVQMDKPKENSNVCIAVTMLMTTRTIATKASSRKECTKFRLKSSQAIVMCLFIYIYVYTSRSLSLSLSLSVKTYL